MRLFVKIFAAFVLSVSFCRQRLELPWSTYAVYLEGKSELIVTIDHPRIRARKVKLSKIMQEPTPYTNGGEHDAYLGKPAGSFQKKHEFTGGWIFKYGLLDEKDQIKTTNPHPNNLDGRVAIHPTFYTKETIVPFRCDLTTMEKCGFNFIAIPLDMKRGVKILATQGYVDFQEYGAGDIGQKIKGKLKASDGKHFWVEGWFDFTVVKVEKH